VTIVNPLVAPPPRNKGYPRQSGYIRETHDFYVEPRWVTRLLLDVEQFDGEILDPCCGIGSIPAVCRERGLSASGSDIVDYGFGAQRDLFSITDEVDNIISNVPYALSERCAEYMLALARRKVALILPMSFWESEGRETFFRQHPPIRWWACASRPSMPPGTLAGERDKFGAVIQPPSKGGTQPYGWFVWERGYQGQTTALRLPLRPKEAKARAKRRKKEIN